MKKRTRRIGSTIAICMLLLGIAGARQVSAQSLGNAQENAACRQDVKRFCQAELQKNPNDALSITACLQANRAKISRGCRNTLASHGQ